VKNRDFTHALNIVKNEGVSTLKDLMTDRNHHLGEEAQRVGEAVGQKRYVDAIRKHDVTFGIGPAGTGQILLAVSMALAALLEGNVARIILTRPAVEAGEALGFCRVTFMKRSCLICALCMMLCRT